MMSLMLWDEIVNYFNSTNNSIIEVVFKFIIPMIICACVDKFKDKRGK